MDIEDHGHGLIHEDLERPEERVAHRAEDGLVGLLDGSFPSFVAGFFTETLCLLS